MHRKRLLSTVAVLALCLCALAAVTLDSEDSEAASGTPGSTVSLTWHDMDEEFEISRFCIIDTIFGWRVEPPVTKSGSSARITIPAEAANGNYTFIESCVNPENGEELDHYTQTVTVSGQKGTSSSNPYSGPVSTPSSMGGYQNLSRTVYVSSGSSVNIDILQWNRENKDSLTITNGAGLSISTVNSYTKKVSGTLTSDCTITAKTWDTSSYKTITIALKSVGGSATEYTCYLYYNANGGSGAPSTQSYTGTSTSSHNFTVASGTPVRSGYEFLGWSTSNSASTASYTAGDTISVAYNGSKTLYAVWKQNVTNYTVTIHKGNWESFKLLGVDSSNITSSSKTYTVASGTTIDVDWYGKAAENGSGANYTYTTTYTSSNYDMASSLYGTSIGDSVIVTKNASYYPATEMKSETVYTYSYTIKYNANGGSGAPSNYTTTDGSPTKTIQLSPVTPTKPGYQFLGWSKSSTATSPSYNAGSSYSFDYGSIQLYAVWKQLSITVSGTPDSHAVVGNYWSFSPTVSVSGCSVSISGAPWLSATGTTVSGTPTQTGEYNVTLTFSKSGYTSTTKSFTVTVISSLEFTSSPSGGAIIYAI